MNSLRFVSIGAAIGSAVDSKGNIYVGENFDGRRFQRFVYKGMGAPTGKTLPPPKP